jgi:hypothetical protein
MLVSKLLKNEFDNLNRVKKDYENEKIFPINEVKLVDSVVKSISNNIYYNLSIINQVQTDPLGVLPSISIPKQAVFDTQRADAIISSPSEYRVSVSRFSIPSGLIPLLLFPVNPSYYAITLTFDNGGVINQITKNLTYIPSAVGDPYGKYRPVYYINELIQYVNIAYKEAYDEMKTTYGAGYTPANRPYLTYDAETKLITMWCDDEYLDFDTYGIFMNTTLFEGFFSGFYSREATTNQLTNFNGFQLLPQNLFINEETNITIPNGNTTTMYKIVSEFSTIPLFNQLDRIVITTFSLPINTQLLGTQLDRRANILLDFILPDDIQTKQKYEYIPTIYKWSDMKQGTPLTKMDLQLYLIYNTGEILPLYIQADQRIDIQLLFTPKGTLYQ